MNMLGFLDQKNIALCISANNSNAYNYNYNFIIIFMHTVIKHYQCIQTIAMPCCHRCVMHAKIIKALPSLSTVNVPPEEALRLSPSAPKNDKRRRVARIKPDGM